MCELAHVYKHGREQANKPSLQLRVECFAILHLPGLSHLFTIIFYAHGRSQSIPLCVPYSLKFLGH